jgi:hypothetical protein
MKDIAFHIGGKKTQHNTRQHTTHNTTRDKTRQHGTRQGMDGEK